MKLIYVFMQSNNKPGQQLFLFIQNQLESYQFLYHFCSCLIIKIIVTIVTRRTQNFWCLCHLANTHSDNPCMSDLFNLKTVATIKQWPVFLTALLSITVCAHYVIHLSFQSTVCGMEVWCSNNWAIQARGQM